MVEREVETAGLVQATRELLDPDLRPAELRGLGIATC